MFTRRRFLAAGGALGAASLLPSGTGTAQAGPSAAREEVVISDTVGPGDVGTYRYYSFEVPPGVQRLDAALDKSRLGPGATLGFGVFDHRGPGYQSPGFRGIYGGESSEFFLTRSDASLSFLPGPIRPGTWTFIVPVFAASTPGTFIIRALLSSDRAAGPVRPFHAVGVVDPRPGWYRGDLHCHTPHSSDARASGSSLLPREWAETCRRIGLDFASMTDHNVVSQNLSLNEAAGEGVLLMPGEEMTNWFHGHATVSGLDPGEWLDWRQRPLQLPLGDHERRLTDFLATAREMGTFVSAAHPLFPVPSLDWEFFGDAEADPAATPPALEVWTGPFYSQAAVDVWDGYLRRGRRVVANGGSDLHGTVNSFGFEAGEPTTVVYAQKLATHALVNALRQGRCFITRRPDGGELYLTATGPGGQATYTGGTIYGASTDVVDLEVLVRRGALLLDAPVLRLLVLRDGVVVSETPVTEVEQVVRTSMAIGPGGYVRVELRSLPEINPTNPLLSRPDMEALTNPIWLSTERRPRHERAEHAPPDPMRPQAEGSLGGQGGVATSMGAGLAAAAVAVRAASSPPAGAPMTVYEFVFRAENDADLSGRRVVLAGHVTATSDAGFRLTRWVPDCCGQDRRPVHVDCTGSFATPPLDRSVRVDGVWVEGTGGPGAGPPSLLVRQLELLTEALPRSEHTPAEHTSTVQ